MKKILVIFTSNKKIIVILFKLLNRMKKMIKLKKIMIQLYIIMTPLKKNNN